jgi:D-alanyl-D-alanine carboxypeptidase
MAFELCRYLPWQRPGLWRRLSHDLWRRLSAAGLAALLALHPLLAHARESGRHAVLVVDANTGRTLYQRAADELRHPASLTKLMTLYLLFELIEQGRLSVTSKITFSAHAVSAPPSSLEVEAGTEITVIDAIKALIVKSANDVAIAVAERIAGSEERFAQLMTRKAHELGMKSTEFRNASGLPDSEQVTTARDIMVLALRLYDQFPSYYPLFATRTFTWRGDTYRNHNTLLFRYRGLEGMKTGYIRAAGFNLVAAARRGRKHVLVAYFGGKTSAQRNAAVRAHLDSAFAKASESKTRRPAPADAAQRKSASMGGQTNETAVASASAPAPQPGKLVAGASDIEVARVRPVRAPLRAAMAPLEPDGEASAKADAPPSAHATDADSADELASAPEGSFHVQVGAYQTKGDAERQLAWVRERAGAVLAAHAPHTSQVKRGDKVFFRARYVGFSAQAAADDVCSDLKRLEIDCLVMKAE